jgi:flagellar biogenesis protein FliO
MPDGNILNGFLTMGLIVLALGFILMMVKKYAKKSGKFSGGMNFNIVSKISLQPKTHIFVIEVAGRKLLIGTTEHNISALADLTDSGGESSFDDNLNTAFAGIKTQAQAAKLKIKNKTPQTIALPPEINEDSLSFGSFLKSTFKKQVN